MGQRIRKGLVDDDAHQHADTGSAIVDTSPGGRHTYSERLGRRLGEIKMRALNDVELNSTVTSVGQHLAQIVQNTEAQPADVGSQLGTYAKHKERD